MDAVASHKTMVEVDMHNNSLTPEGKAVVTLLKSEASNKNLKQIFLNWQLPSPTYFADVQKHVSPVMRCILIDWLTDVTQMLINTSFFNSDGAPCFFLACMCIDRYMRKRLQLVGVASFLVAVQHYEKLSDDSPATAQFANWFAEVTAKAYTAEEVVECAQDIR